MISHGLPMQLIRYSDWPESDLGAEDTMGTYSMGTGVLVSVEGWPVCRLPLKDRRKSYKQISFSYKSLAKLMTHLHQDNSEQKKLIKWNVSYIIQENWAHRSHSEDEKKLDYWYTRTCQRKWKRFDVSTCKKSIQSLMI